MIINLRAIGMDMTPAIRQYVETKFQMLEKYATKILQADIDLGMETHHHQKGKIYTCSAVLKIPKHPLQISKRAEDLYKVIDKVKDHLHELLIEKKERMRKNRRIEETPIM